MGGNVDDSMMSTASTLVDSCSESFVENNHIEAGKENRGMKSLLRRGKIANFAVGRFDVQKGQVRIVSPTTTTIDVSNDWSEETSASKLEHLRAKTKLLREQSTQKIEDSRASLRKTRTLSNESPQASAHPPPYPPPSVQNTVTDARMKGTQSTDEREFSDFLRRSNSVIDRLSTEIATAGSIINEDSSRADRTVNKKNVKKTNDFASNLYPMYKDRNVGKTKRNSRYKLSSGHNTSVDEDWCQSTISASSSPPGSPESSAPESREPLIDASGLPPPEVVVKTISPRASPRSTEPVEDELSWGTPSTKLALKARFENRLRRQRHSSVSSIGDCASMYNTKQKCEKLELENDCLKRQLDLLERRHRDAQQQLLADQNLQGEQRLGKFSSSTSKRKSRNGYYWVAFLVLAPFIISSLSWLNGSHSNISTSKTIASSQDPIGETVFSDKIGDANDKDKRTATHFFDELDNSLVLHAPPIEYREKQDEPSGKFVKFVNHIQRLTSNIKYRERHDFTGVWTKVHGRIKMKKKHAEL